METESGAKSGGEALGEGLLAPGAVRLFGRPFTGLSVGDLAASASRSHPLAVAEREARKLGREPGLARIYGFSYLGTYAKLSEPAVFLVFDAGEPVPAGAADPDASVGMAGCEYPTGVFAEGLRLWIIDQLDMLVRIDIRIGWAADLLLSEMNGDGAGGAARRADLVGRDANLVGRDANLIGRGR